MKSTAKKPNLFVMKSLGVICLSVLIIFLPYKAGLYNGSGIQYEIPQQISMILAFILMGLSTLYLFKHWKIPNSKAFLSLFSLVIPLFYFISSFHGASTHSAQTMVLIAAMLSFFFIMALYLGEVASTQKILSAALTLSVYCIVVFGIMNMFGQIYYPDAIWFTDGQYRLSSVFQYSNTYAGFLCAVLMVCFYWITTSTKWYWLLLHSLMLVPISVSILLTLSRGALVVLPILVIILFIFLQIREQVFALVAMLITLIVTLIILGKLSAIYQKIAEIVQPHSGKQAATISMFHPLALQGWGILIAASLVCYSLIFVYRRWFSTWVNNKLPDRAKTVSLWIPGSVVVLAVLLVLLLSSNTFANLFPKTIADRIQNINFQQHSVLERETFYRDAMKLVRDHPFIGTGGGGWSVLYEHYQNNPYSSRQVHSYLIQTLVEIGWVGFVFFAAFLISVYFLYIKYYFRSKTAGSTHLVFFLFSISLLIHSFIDFDMSFTYLGILIFFCLGSMLAPFHEQMFFRKWPLSGEATLRRIFPAFLLVLSVVLLVWTIREYTANRTYEKAINLANVQKRGLSEVLVPLDKAINSSPSNAELSLTKIEWLNEAYQQTHDKHYLENIRVLIAQLEKFEPYNNQLILTKYRYFKDSGDSERSIEVLEDAINKFPWGIQYYQGAMMEYAEAGIQQAQAGDSGTAEQYWNRSLKIYDEILKKMEQLKTLPTEQLQGRIFNQTPYIREAIGSIYYWKKDFGNAADLLKPLEQEDFKDPYIRIGVRYYLASLFALGEQDENLKQRLIDSDPQEKQLLEQLYLQK